MTATTKVIRAAITEAEWQKTRERALKKRIPVALFVGNAIREALKGRAA
jgi:hypothetical protein